METYQAGVNEIYQRKLVEEAAGGSDAAFEKLIELKRKDVLYLAMRLTSPEEGEDIAQEAFIQAYRDIKNIRHPEKFNSWMYGVVRNACYNIMKKKRKDQAIALDPQGYSFSDVEEDRHEFLPAQLLEQNEMQAQLMNAIQALPLTNRECIMLFYYEGLSYKEIAEALSCDEKKVSNELSRAKSLLKEKLVAGSRGQVKAGGALITAGPVLSQVLHADANQLVTVDMCERVSAHLHDAILLAAGVAGTAGATATTTAAATASTAEAVATTGTTTAGPATSITPATTASVVKSAGMAKAAAAAAVCVVLAGGAVALGNAYQGDPEAPAPSQQQEAPLEEPVPTQAALPEATPAAEPTTTETPAAAPRTINTLEDMIGEDAANLLYEYLALNVYPFAWNVYPPTIGAEQIGLVSDSKGALYRVYQLDEQDKRLLLYEKDDGSGILNIRYDFGDAAVTPIPNVMQVVTRFA